ncbi:ABC transporter ATP-binding protein [Virgibacillus chiguensis]|uniref:ATP-binding cassette, subfamily B n=1 Tax=Virgibacillus chiguensis TaxID=411959 RepID=A0A1M5TA57_9BACI|nr:ABC transporter ATP-binding protein [Virgibacillus chiguensis]SHH47568.1 ATP-binding cassette, subfamily B [Virgibacillus chiguensis]
MEDTSDFKKSFSLFIKSQTYFLKLIIKEHPKLFFLFSLLTLFISLLPPFIIYLNKELIDSISIISSNSNMLKTSIILLSIFFFLNYLDSVINLINEYIFSKISYTVNYVLKSLLIDKYIAIPLKEYEDSSFYDTIGLSNSAIDGNGVKVVQEVISIIGSMISAIGIFGTLLSIHWSLPIALFFSSLPGIIFLVMAKQKGFDMQREVSPDERELGFTDGLFVNRSVLKEIKLFNSGSFLINKWSYLFKKVRNKKMSIQKWEVKTQSFAALVLQISSLGVSIFLVLQIYRGDLSIGSYVALLTAVTAIQGIFGGIGGSLGNVFETAIYNNALLKILNYKINNTSDNNEKKLVDIQTICFENATFSYPKTSIKVLENVNLTITKGEKVSIVGANGSGKTTLVNCILGLYQLTSGKIKVNDIDIKEINITDYYKDISVIFQDFTKYKYTLKENINFSNETNDLAEGEIFESLKKVSLDEKVLTFKEGLNTYLTKEMPNGSELSGGEWQRVALARAVYKNTNFIVLDEPTAALDPIAELEIFNMFHNISKDKTSVTVSHRIGPTKLSDRIIVIEKGEIVEEGTFNYLMSTKGLYYKMYKAQSKWYDSESKQALTIT